jgi:hypothetical protein
MGLQSSFATHTKAYQFKFFVDIACVDTSLHYYVHLPVFKTQSEPIFHFSLCLIG